MANTRTSRAHAVRHAIGRAAAKQNYVLEEAALLLGLAPALLALRIEVGDLPATRQDGDLRISIADLLKFKTSFDRQQKALRELVDESEDLMAKHDL